MTHRCQFSETAVCYLQSASYSKSVASGLPSGFGGRPVIRLSVRIENTSLPDKLGSAIRHHCMNYKFKSSTQLLSCIFCICGLFLSTSAVAQNVASSPIEVGETQAFALMDEGAPGGEPQQSERQPQGSVSGTVVDQAGAVVVGANVRLTIKDQAQRQDVLSGDNGQFSFSSLVPSPFQLTISAPGFETKLVSGIVNPGQAFIVPPIVLTVAATTTDVSVSLSEAELLRKRLKSRRSNAYLASSRTFIPPMYPILRRWARSRSSRWPGNRLLTPLAL